MSLFGAIQVARSSLQANQIAMQVIAQNLANANTPGYIREEVVLNPAPAQRLGNLVLGMGVEVTGVVQKIDLFLEERMRASVSARASSEAQESAYLALEGLIGELTDTDLSTSLTNFLSSVSDVMNDPGDPSVRLLAVLYGTSLASDINRLARRANEVRDDANNRIQDMAGRINELTEEIGVLNVRIARLEGGGASSSDAVGLRDRRLAALEQLSELVSIRVEEQPNGTTTVYAGRDFLVYERVTRQVEAVFGASNGLATVDIHLIETEAPLDISGGAVLGQTLARDDILGDFLSRLDVFAQTLAFEFNKIHTSGQGLSGYTTLTGEFGATSGTEPLDQVGLPFTPENGSFEFLVYNTETGLTETTEVLVALDGAGTETTLDDLAASLDAVAGVSAVVTADGELTITADSTDQEFAFANDTSGILAALGLNTFFSGSTARDLGVTSVLRDDPGKFAMSRGGIGLDTENGVTLANFLDLSIESQGGVPFSAVYDRLMGETIQGSAVARGVAEGDRMFEQTLQSQKLATSGVSIDEEAVRLIGFQHSFQASARFISVLGELFDVLVNI